MSWIARNQRSFAGLALVLVAAVSRMMQPDVLDGCQETYYISPLGDLIVSCTVLEAGCPPAPDNCKLSVLSWGFFQSVVTCGCGAQDEQSPFCSARVWVTTGGNKYLGSECSGLCLLEEPPCRERSGTAADNAGLSMCWCHF